MAGRWWVGTAGALIAAACGTAWGAELAVNRGLYAHRSLEGRLKAMGGRGGTSAKAESAVKAGLVWLARAQEKDGSWNARAWEGIAPHTVGATGLSLLAFQGAGYTHKADPFAQTVHRGLSWLKAQQRPDGSFPHKTFYEQGIATIAVCEAYAMTGNAALGRTAQKGVDYIIKTQPAHGGFRYKGAVPKGEGDLSVTGWQMLAIVSGHCAGLSLSPITFDRCRTFLANTRRDHGASAYLVADKKAGSKAVTAIGMVCRMFLDPGGSRDHIRQAARYLLLWEIRGQGPVPGGGSKQLVTDLYYTYWSSLAMFQFGGDEWRDWNVMVRDRLVRAQVGRRQDARGRSLYGSWEPANHKWAKHSGGRVYATAMAVLCLETCYRYARFHKR